MIMYIDPNSGGMLFQLLAGMLAGLTGVLLLFSGKIKTFIAKAKRAAREKQESKKDEN